jgi:Protein of unknown function DUF262
MALEKWTLKEIAAYLDKDSSGAEYYLKVPKFQRKMVWSDEKIVKLVDSIYRGYPIGSLLVYQTEEIEESKIVLQLVDGLQRSTSIAKFLKTPLKFAPLRDFISDELIETCANQTYGDVSEASMDKVFANMTAWFHSVSDLALGAEYNANKLAEAIADGDVEARTRLVMWNADTNAIEVLLGNVLEQLNNFINYEVPLNIYRGPIENVPTIFERVNSQGTPLSKYDILAASWISTDVAVSNIDVVTAIHANYSARVANGAYVIEGFDADEDVEPGTYNLYEYLFGLGKVLSSQCPTIFPDSDKADEINPIAFQILTLACKLPVSKMGQLDQYLPKGADGILQVDLAEKAILEAAKSAEQALNPYFAFKLNSSEPGDSGIKQNQAISYVTSYLANIFNDDYSRKPDANQVAGKIRTNIPGHFIIDLLRDRWSGSGDSTLFERTWTKDVDSSGAEFIAASNHYLNPISRQNLEETFESWHAEQLEKTQKERAAYPKDVRPVLKFLYSPIVSIFHAHSVKFELEHIYPVAYLKKIIKKDSLEGLAMGALGNLMLIPKPINRIKKAHLLGDWIAKNPETPDNLDQLRRYLIDPRIEDVVDAGHLSEQAFKDFCQSRARHMVAQIATHMNLP